MDYLFRKSDSSANSLGGTVGRVTLPEMQGGDVVFTGNQRPLDLGKYVLVKAIEVTEEVTSTKKRGPTTTAIDGDKQTVTLTHTAVDLTTAEKAQIEINRLEALETPTKLAEAVLTDAGKTWLQDNRNLIKTELDKL
mgnify:FL=1|tara:strand:+ start:614 stop:1024 length:411 start_codon:yes stop_codon:yes gene_type:complete